MAFEIENLLKAFGGNRTIVERLSQVFLTEAPKQMSELQQAIQAGNPAEVERTAHTVKGALMNFYFAEAVELAEAIETGAASGDVSLAPALYARLQEGVEGMFTSLKTF